MIFKIFEIEHVYCTETRPYNQGARLTAYELVHDKLPATLVLDSMVAALLRAKNVAAVVVGADRVRTFHMHMITRIIYFKYFFFRWLLMVIQPIKLAPIKLPS